ncbi:MAG TPA: hypothetical protein VKP65_06975 [Rhodothermales bacterium]|nr:hypothetical protein [Rhodothermales bacterium]
MATDPLDYAPVSVELGGLAHYLDMNPLERERLEALLQDMDNLGFTRHFGAQQQGSSPVSRSPADSLGLSVGSVVQRTRSLTQEEAERAAQSSCDVTDLLGECIEPPVPVVRSQ